MEDECKNLAIVEMQNLMEEVRSPDLTLDGGFSNPHAACC